MRTTRNILLGLIAFAVGISSLQAGNKNTQKNRKSTEGWVSVGPSNIQGRILAIYVDKDDNSRIYAGTAGSGLWITTNGGASWSRSAGFTGSAAVSAITQGSDGRLFVGTGEGLNPDYAAPGVVDNLNPYGIMGNGVYVSTDKGVSFTQLTATASWREVNAMAYDKKNNWLYVGTNAGLQVSKDNGNSFAQAIPGSNNKVFDVKTGSDGSVICVLYVGGNGDVRVSTDNGGTFTSVCGTGATMLPRDAGRIAVDIATSNPNIMYASVAKAAPEIGLNGYSFFGGVYVSTDKGSSWRRIFNPGGYDDPMEWNGTYQNVIAISQTDPDKVLVGSLHLYQLMKTDQKDDKGDALYSKQQRTMYSGIHSIFYSGNVIYLGTSSGILYYTDDFMNFDTRNRSLINLQVYSMSVSVDGRIIAGTRDNGCIYIRNPKSWDAHAESLYSGRSGGKSAFSFVKPEAVHCWFSYRGFRQASAESDAQSPSQWFGSGETWLMRPADDDYPRWFQSSFAELATPFVFWESVKDYHSKDTIKYIADRNYNPNEEICAKSARNKYPVWTTNTTGNILQKDSMLLVQDIVTSRLFLGGAGYLGGITTLNIPIGAPVGMSLTALNYDVAQVWVCVFHTDDMDEQVRDLVVSKDGDHLFILTKKAGGGYVIYRVSGFDQYRKLEEVDKFNYDYINGGGYGGTTGGTFTANSLRMLVDDTLLIHGGDDILSIALDPNNDDNLIYTTNGSFDRINLISNATTATLSTADIKSKEGSGLPNNLPVYTGLIVKEAKSSSSSKIAYVGTERGIYKTNDITSLSPVWESYNKGVDLDVPVFQLYQQINDVEPAVSVTYDADSPTEIYFAGASSYGNIYAATHGAGIFVDSTYWDGYIVGMPTYPIANDNKIKVYPNPASSSISIDYALQSNETVQIKIVDIIGRIIYTENLGAGKSGHYSKTIDCSHLSEGFYFVNMVIGKQTKVAKFVVIK